MDVVDLSVDPLREAPWNPNIMDGEMLERLRVSISLYGLVEPLVVRPDGSETYEVLSGNQRLHLLKEQEYTIAPCVVIDVDDAHATLLAQALNHVHGTDDLGLRAELMREVLAAVPQNEVLSLLPETPESLRDLASLGQGDLAVHLQAWQRAQAARLRHLQFQLTDAQLEVVEETLARVLPRVRDAQGTSPNVRGTALYLLCRDYLIAAGGTS